MNIYQRINEVRKAVQYIQKDASVQGYRAVTHDMVTAKVRDHLIEHGIAIIPDQRWSTDYEFQTAKGTRMVHYTAWYEVSFVNIDDPTDKIMFRMEAHADDMSDKAPGKAASYAVKYAMLKLFNLETGENEESRVEGARQQESFIKYLKGEIQEFIDSGDSLGIMLIARKLGQEAWTDVYNSAPDGKKMEFKKTLGELEKQGHEILKAINTAILKGDDLQAKENTEDLNESTKRLLADYLGADKVKRLGELLKEKK